MKRIAQLRYHGEKSPLNNPTSLTKLDWTLGNIFENYGTVSHLGIQGVPGLRFYLNNGNNSIMIGDTGIYEINLEHIGRITALRFEDDKIFQDAYDKQSNISDSRNSLIVDIVYEGAGVSA